MELPLDVSKAIERARKEISLKFIDDIAEVEDNDPQEFRVTAFRKEGRKSINQLYCITINKSGVFLEASNQAIRAMLEKLKSFIMSQMKFSCEPA